MAECLSLIRKTLVGSRRNVPLLQISISPCTTLSTVWRNAVPLTSFFKIPNQNCSVPPSRLSTPLDNGEEHLNTKCPLSAKSCITLSTVESPCSVILFGVRPYRFSSSQGPSDDHPSWMFPKSCRFTMILTSSTKTQDWITQNKNL